MSARLTIAAYEMLLSNIERRCLVSGHSQVAIRLCDLYALVPAISGKLELVYEGQEAGADVVAGRLISLAIKAVFTRHFPHAQDEEEAYRGVMDWFNAGRSVEVLDEDSEEECFSKLEQVDGLKELIDAELVEFLRRSAFWLWRWL